MPKAKLLIKDDETQYKWTYGNAVGDILIGKSGAGMAVKIDDEFYATELFVGCTSAQGLVSHDTSAIFLERNCVANTGKNVKDAWMHGSSIFYLASDKKIYSFTPEVHPLTGFYTGEDFESALGAEWVAGARTDTRAFAGTWSLDMDDATLKLPGTFDGNFSFKLYIDSNMGAPPGFGGYVITFSNGVDWNNYEGIVINQDLVSFGHFVREVSVVGGVETEISSTFVDSVFGLKTWVDWELVNGVFIGHDVGVDWSRFTHVSWFEPGNVDNIVCSIPFVQTELTTPIPNTGIHTMTVWVDHVDAAVIDVKFDGFFTASLPPDTGLHAYFVNLDMDNNQFTMIKDTAVNYLYDGVAATAAQIDEIEFLVKGDVDWEEYANAVIPTYRHTYVNIDQNDRSVNTFITAPGGKKALLYTALNTGAQGAVGIDISKSTIAAGDTIEITLAITPYGNSGNLIPFAITNAAFTTAMTCVFAVEFDTTFILDGAGMTGISNLNVDDVIKIVFTSATEYSLYVNDVNVFEDHTFENAITSIAYAAMGSAADAGGGQMAFDEVSCSWLPNTSANTFSYGNPVITSVEVIDLSAYTILYIGAADDDFYYFGTATGTNVDIVGRKVMLDDPWTVSTVHADMGTNKWYTYDFPEWERIMGIFKQNCWLLLDPFGGGQEAPSLMDDDGDVLIYCGPFFQLQPADRIMVSTDGQLTATNNNVRVSSVVQEQWIKGRCAAAVLLGQGAYVSDGYLFYTKDVDCDYELVKYIDAHSSASIFLEDDVDPLACMIENGDYIVFTGWVNEFVESLNERRINLLGWDNTFYRGRMDVPFAGYSTQDICFYDESLVHGTDPDIWPPQELKGFVYNQPASALIAFACDVADLFNFVRNCSMIQWSATLPLVDLGAAGLVSTKKVKMNVGSVVVIGAQTTTGQIKKTATTGFSGPQLVYYVPECTTRAQATTIATERALAVDRTEKVVITARTQHEFLANVDASNYYVIEEKDTNGEVMLTLSDAWLQEGDIHANEKQRGNHNAAIAASAADATADGVAATVTNTTTSLTQGFLRVYTSATAPTGVEGLMWYDSSANLRLMVYSGGAWRNV